VNTHDRPEPARTRRDAFAHRPIGRDRHDLVLVQASDEDAPRRGIPGRPLRDEVALRDRCPDRAERDLALRQSGERVDVGEVAAERGYVRIAQRGARIPRVPAQELREIGPRLGVPPGKPVRVRAQEDDIRMIRGDGRQ
jgi:hypothetical protein